MHIKGNITLYIDREKGQYKKTVENPALKRNVRNPVDSETCITKEIYET